MVWNVRFFRLKILKYTFSHNRSSGQKTPEELSVSTNVWNESRETKLKLWSMINFYLWSFTARPVKQFLRFKLFTQVLWRNIICFVSLSLKNTWSFYNFFYRLCMQRLRNHLKNPIHPQNVSTLSLVKVVGLVWSLQRNHLIMRLLIKLYFTILKIVIF